MGNYEDKSISPQKLVKEKTIKTTVHLALAACQTYMLTDLYTLSSLINQACEVGSLSSHRLTGTYIQTEPEKPDSKCREQAYCYERGEGLGGIN